MRGLTSRALFFPLLFAGLQLAIHIAFSGSYGYFRDELYYIACSKHLAWGYVDHPPLSILFLAIARFFLGDSLLAIRILASLAGAVVVVLAAMIARQLGGNMAEMFEIISSTIRERFRLEGKIRALTSQGKLQGWIVGMMPLALGFAVYALRPDLMGPMLESWFGYSLIALIIVMEICGMWLIRRIVDIDV